MSLPQVSVAWAFTAPLQRPLHEHVVLLAVTGGGAGAVVAALSLGESPEASGLNGASEICPAHSCQMGRYRPAPAPSKFRNGLSIVQGWVSGSDFGYHHLLLPHGFPLYLGEGGGGPSMGRVPVNAGIRYEEGASGLEPQCRTPACVLRP